MEEPIVDASKDYRRPAPIEEEHPERHFDLRAVFFDYDKATLKPAGKKALQKNAQWMKKNPTAHVQIEGRCDERGSYEYNLRLGERRAIAAKEFLVSMGVDPDRISTVSYGAVPGTEERIRAKNRNASAVIVYAK